jgi:hypothetical protein
MGLYGDSMQASILPIPEIYVKLLYVSSSDEIAMLSLRRVVENGNSLYYDVTACL